MLLSKQMLLHMVMAMLRSLDATDDGTSCPWSVDVEIYFCDFCAERLALADRRANSGMMQAEIENVSGTSETGMSDCAEGEKLLASAGGTAETGMSEDAEGGNLLASAVRNEFIVMS